MKTINDHHLKFTLVVGRVPPHALSATFIVKGTFKLVAGGVAELLPEDGQAEFSGDVHTGGDPSKGLRYASDFALFKPNADLLLAGHCHAPEGQAFVKTSVAFGVGQVGKRLEVFGDRLWEPGAVGPRASDPVPFASMPLDWTRAFGGPGYAPNPAGRGAGPTELEDGTRLPLLPNIEAADALVTSPRDKPVIGAGFGPIDPASPLRVGKLGSYDQAWLDQHWPWLPEDFDWTFFNAAPPDQQLREHYLTGDERLRFKNMHPSFPSYECTLAGQSVRVFVRRRVGLRLIFEEVVVKLDTLFVDMDAETATLIWRGVTPATSMKLKEFEESFVLLEPVGKPLAADLMGYARICAGRKKEIADAETMEFKPLDPAVVVPPRLPDMSWVPRLEAQFAQLDAKRALEASHPMDAEWAKLFGAARPLAAVPSAPPINTLAEGASLIKAELAKLRATEPGTAKVFDSVPMDWANFERDVAEDEKLLLPATAEIADFPDEKGEWTRERVEAHALEKGAFDGEDLSNLDLSGMNLSNLSFLQSVLDECVLDGCNFDGSNLTGASLGKVGLAGASFRSATLQNADFSESFAADSVWDGADLSGAEFTATKMPGASFKDCTGKKPGFSACDLTQANFEACRFQQPDFTAATLVGSIFRNAHMPDAGCYEIVADGADFQDAEMTRGRFSDAQMMDASFARCRLEDGTFENARLAKCNFTESRLSRTLFTGARAPHATFHRAICIQSKFDDCAVSAAQFFQTNLFRASFENADLTGATFYDSNCYEVEFFQAITKDATFEETILWRTKLG